MSASSIARGLSSLSRPGSKHKLGLSGMLREQEQVKYGKKVKLLTYQAWNRFNEHRALAPDSLTYKVVTPSPRKKFRRLAVAAPPEVTRQSDPFHKLNLDPRSLTTSSSVLSHYVTEMGKIKPRTTTNLTAKTQRLLGQTIRRAKMMGIIPQLSR